MSSSFSRKPIASSSASFHTSGIAPYGIVPSDHEGFYRAFLDLRDHGVTVDRVCEWGSGLGVNCALAAMAGADACGIEIRPELVAASRDLHATFDLTVEILEGSFFPESFVEETDAVPAETITILSGSGSVDEVDVEPGDFDVVFAFPWPGEEELYFDLFEDSGAVGAHLITYHGPAEGFWFHRKARDGP